jgi:hypothetical protein
MSKIQKSLIFGFFVGLLDWIGFFQFNPIQLFNKNPTKNPKIQLFWIFDNKRGLKIQFFWIFGVEFGWMFNHPASFISSSLMR